MEILDAFLLVVYLFFNVYIFSFQKYHNFVFSNVNPASMSAMTFRQLSFLPPIIFVSFDFTTCNDCFAKLH